MREFTPFVLVVAIVCAACDYDVDPGDVLLRCRSDDSCVAGFTCRPLLDSTYAALQGESVCLRCQPGPLALESVDACPSSRTMTPAFAIVQTSVCGDVPPSLLANGAQRALSALTTEASAAVAFSADRHAAIGEVVSVTALATDTTAARVTTLRFPVGAGTNTFRSPFGASGVETLLAGGGRAVLAGDLDGDDADELVVLNPEDGIGVWTAHWPEGPRPGRPTSWTEARLTDTPGAVAGALGDLDRDGTLDLVTAGARAATTGWLNRSNGELVATGRRASDDTRDVRLGDLNGDGFLDAVWLRDDTSAGSALLATNDGRGELASVVVTGPPGADALDLGDVDLDGDIDAVFVGARLGLVVWTNDRHGALRPRDLDDLDGPLSVVVVADMNGDRAPDLVLAGPDEGVVAINDGRGHFSMRHAFTPAAQPAALRTGDLDADGDLDLVVVSATQSPTVWLNDGSGVLSTHLATLAQTRPTENLGPDMTGLYAFAYFLEPGSVRDATLELFQTGYMAVAATLDGWVRRASPLGSPDTFGAFYQAELSSAGEFAATSVYLPATYDKEHILNLRGQVLNQDCIALEIRASGCNGGCGGDEVQRVVATRVDSGADCAAAEQLALQPCLDQWQLIPVGETGYCQTANTDVRSLAVADVNADGALDVVLVGSAGTQLWYGQTGVVVSTPPAGALAAQDDELIVDVETETLLGDGERELPLPELVVTGSLLGAYRVVPAERLDTTALTDAHQVWRWRVSPVPPLGETLSLAVTGSAAGPLAEPMMPYSWRAVPTSPEAKPSLSVTNKPLDVEGHLRALQLADANGDHGLDAFVVTETHDGARHLSWWWNFACLAANGGAAASCSAGLADETARSLELPGTSGNSNLAVFSRGVEGVQGLVVSGDVVAVVLPVLSAAGLELELRTDRLCERVAGRLDCAGLQNDGSMGVATGDLDGDGLTDLVTASRTGAEIWYGDARGGFVFVRAEHPPIVADEVVGMALGDFDGDARGGNASNGDGHLDVLLLHADGSHSIWRRMAHGGFASCAAISALPQPEPTLPRLVDIDGDGLLDVVLRNEVLVNQGTTPSTFVSRQAFELLKGDLPDGDYPSPLELAFEAGALHWVVGADADSETDFVLATAGYLLVQKSSTASGFWVPSKVGHITLMSPDHVAIADFDGDLRLDFLVGKNPVSGSTTSHLVLNVSGAL